MLFKFWLVDTIRQMKEFENKVVVITGAASGIGKRIKERFEDEGARVYFIDIKDNDCFVGDVSHKEDLDCFSQFILEREDHIDIIVHNAMPLFKGVDTCEYEEFLQALQVGPAAVFYLAKLWKDLMPKGSSIINITSTRDNQSMPQSESYAASKGGLKSLTHALAVSLGPKIRVNAIAPGWIDTSDVSYEGSDANQQPVGRVGVRDDIADLVLYLCSNKASFITGQEIVVDGGMSKLMVYHGEHGWIKE